MPNISTTFAERPAWLNEDLYPAELVARVRRHGTEGAQAWLEPLLAWVDAAVPMLAELDEIDTACGICNVDDVRYIVDPYTGADRIVLLSTLLSLLAERLDGCGKFRADEHVGVLAELEGKGPAPARFAPGGAYEAWLEQAKATVPDGTADVPVGSDGGER